jgi:hypothetical protein
VTFVGALKICPKGFQTWQTPGRGQNKDKNGFTLFKFLNGEAGEAPNFRPNSFVKNEILTNTGPSQLTLSLTRCAHPGEDARERTTHAFEVVHGA